MLQQTRVEVVVPAYRRFLRHLPTLRRLAAADEERVLSLWSGLGYYSRARALHRAARLLRERGESRFPRDLDAALTLPGVGPYIAAAVLSIADGQPHAAVDANVARVLSRLDRLPAADSRGEPQRSVAVRLLATDRPGDWNEALMELGETICTPRAPRCGECPLRSVCEANLHDEVALHPPARPRRRPERFDLQVHVLSDAGGRLLLERGAFPYLPHLWLPPTWVDSGAPAGQGGRQSAAAAEVGPPTFRHAILHRDFHVRVVREIVSSAELRRRARAAPRAGVESRLFHPEELEAIGRSSLLSKALQHA